MSKICTSIEQSKKLIELGIDKNTANMYWDTKVIPNLVFPINEAKTNWDYAIENKLLPAWSLSALENMIPWAINDNDMVWVFNKWKRSDDSWKIAYHIDETELISFSGNNFDIVFEIVVWLLENKKI